MKYLFSTCVRIVFCHVNSFLYLFQLLLEVQRCRLRQFKKKGMRQHLLKKYSTIFIYNFIFYRYIKDKSLNLMNVIKWNIDSTIVSCSSIISQWYINYSSVKCQLPTYQQSKNTQETQCTCLNIMWTEWYILSVTTVMWTLHGD